LNFQIKGNQMFELSKTKVKLNNVNPRAELHGEDHRIAVDLSISASLPKDILKMFSGELCDFLYTLSDDPDLIEQADITEATQPRFPFMHPIKWDKEFRGFKVIVDYGLGGDSNLELFLTTIDKFVFEPLNGGTVNVKFRIIAHPDSETVGLLCDRIQQDIEITIEAPEPQTAEDLFQPK
jgi:hypothetical protein